MKAQPDSARVDALKLATMMRAVVGDELDEQAAKLPNEVTKVLEDTLCQRPREVTESLSELTMQLALSDMEPSGEHPPVREDQLRAYLPISARDNPTYPVESLSPQGTTLRPVSPAYAPIASLISVGCICLALGLWIGRATAPQGVAPQALVTSRRTVSVAAASPAKPERIAQAAPLTEHPKPRVEQLPTTIDLEPLDIEPAAEPQDEAPAAPAAVKKPAFVRKRPPLKHAKPVAKRTNLSRPF